MQKQLTEIGLKFGTDKAEYHQFTDFYDDYFANVAKDVENPRILEIGILNGESLRMYDEYFRGKAKIVGIDILEKSHLFPHSDNVLCLRGDILNADAIEKCRKAGGTAGYDIIIDDGSHTMEQQQKSLKNLWPMLKPGGYYIIEDLHTSGNDDYNPDRTTTTLAILEGIGESEFIPSIYLDEQTLRGLEAEMEICVVAKNDFPQERTQAARVSITSMIRKKGGEASTNGLVFEASEKIDPPVVTTPQTFQDVIDAVGKTQETEQTKQAEEEQTTVHSGTAGNLTGIVAEPIVNGAGPAPAIKG